MLHRAGCLSTGSWDAVRAAEIGASEERIAELVRMLLELAQSDETKESSEQIFPRGPLTAAYIQPVTHPRNGECRQQEEERGR